MRRAFLLFLFFGLYACPAISSNVPATQFSSPTNNNGTNEIQPKKNISSLRIKDMEKVAGRKFSLTEKIGFLLLKRKLKQQEDTGSREGRTAFSFGLAAAALLILGLFVPYLILGSLVASIVAVVMGSSAVKKNPNDRKAHSGRLLGWITLGLFALILILIAIALSSWNW